jgi:acylphosphatase
MSERAALRAVIRGRVQMVGFRYFALQRAQDHAVTGWVRNRRDGTVEVEAGGPRPALERFLEDLRMGPPSGEVTGIDVEWLETAPDHDGFQIAPSG